MSQRKKLEQGRAEFAYQCAEKGRDGENGAKPKEYKSYCKNIPMMIKANGLGATLAFMKSKGGGTYKLIYEQVYQYLKKYDKMNIFNKDTNEDLVKVIISQNSAEYRYLTVETLAFFNWLRRFAEGLIEGEN